MPNLESFGYRNLNLKTEGKFAIQKQRYPILPPFPGANSRDLSQLPTSK